MDKDIIEGLKSIPDIELFILYYDIKHVIEDKEIDDEIILNSIKEINKKYNFSESHHVSYDKLTLYLEKKSYKRETISKKILDLIGAGKIDFVQSWTTEMHPTYEGKKHVEIGFIYFQHHWYKDKGIFTKLYHFLTMLSFK